MILVVNLWQRLLIPVIDSLPHNNGEISLLRTYADELDVAVWMANVFIGFINSSVSFGSTNSRVKSEYYLFNQRYKTRVLGLPQPRRKPRTSASPPTPQRQVSDILYRPSNFRRGGGAFQQMLIRLFAIVPFMQSPQDKAAPLQEEPGTGMSRSGAPIIGRDAQFHYKSVFAAF